MRSFSKSTARRAVLCVVAAFAAGGGLALAQTAGTDQPPPPPPHRGPPAESLAACQSLIAGDTCAFTMGSRRVEGTCGAPPGLQLACMPNDRPPPPPPPQGQAPAN